jgi:hypothetical protein
MDTWRISWRWASKALDCTAAGIASGCHAGCCFSRRGTYWPASAHSPVDGPCFWLGDSGCRLSPEDRPISCLIIMYPLVLNNANTCVMHFRGRRGCCRANVGHGPRLIDALWASLTALFGADQAKAIGDAIRAERDAEIAIGELLTCQWRLELELRATKRIPSPRRDWVS